MRLKRGVERESCDFCHGRKIKCDRPLRAASGIHTCSACARRDIACRVDDSGDIRLQKRRLNSQKDVSSIDGQHVPSRALLSPPRVADSSPAVAPESTAIPDTAEEAQAALFDLNAESAFFLDQIFVGNLSSESLYDNLPITFEDAFWSDVQASTASAAFVCAVACRGMPFTEHDEKWLLQKQLAIKFKNLFLQKQQDDPNNTPLDDIEALALMVDFPFDEDDVSGLERLFLSKKSLVLMTLQLGHSTEAGTLSRASERHSLLFWHVYGLDAFACLDSKTASRIPEAETLPHLRNTGSGYLDAVLSLALVARAILQKLCESARHGVRYADVESLYKQLEHWRDSSCPPHLRRWRADEGEAPSQHLNVQRGVLHLLRINCYMQIENWTDEHGVTVKTMADMMTGPRVEYESLCAVSEGAEMAEWMNSCLVGGYALVDLAPNILRDINAGLGVWTCLHGMQSRAKSTYRVHGHDTGAVAGASLEVAALFRSAVAKAVSHCDTAIVLGRIDAKMAFLRDPGNS